MTSVAYPNFPDSVYGNPAPTYSFTFDAMGRLNGMTDQNNNSDVYGVSYGPSNELLGMFYFGASESRTYNSRLQLTNINVGAYGVNLTYTYPTNGTNNGKISSQTNNVSGETVQYTYDSLNRLIQAQATNNSWGQGFTYDPFGNLTAKTVTAGSAPSLSVTVDPTTNRISGFSNIYDANGNQTGYNGNSYGYDVENRMVEAYGNPLFMYAYSPQNKRVWKGTYDQNWNLTAQEAYFYGVDGKKLGTYSVHFQGGAGASSTSLLVYFGRRQVGTQTGSTAAFVADRLGSLASGASFYPYGEDKGTPAPNDQVKFATYTRDSVTLLDYADQRYYNNALGRFMSPDPSESSAGPTSPTSWNRYAYTESDPVNGYDPTGLITVLPDGPAPTNCYINGTASACGALDGTPSEPLQRRPHPPKPPAPKPSPRATPVPASFVFIGATPVKGFNYNAPPPGCHGAPLGAFATETFEVLDQFNQPFAVGALTVQEMITNEVVVVDGAPFAFPDKNTWVATTDPGPTLTNAAGQFIDSPFGLCSDPPPGTLIFDQQYRVLYNGSYYTLGPILAVSLSEGFNSVTVTTQSYSFTVGR